MGLHLQVAKLAAVTMDEQGNETFDTTGALDCVSWCNLKGVPCTMIQTASCGSWTRNGRIILRKSGLRYLKMVLMNLRITV
nr:uncharacterized protein LOC117274471 isoform X2 [Nicotiana tomentosiformis]XP_033509666.1 uncharacterized protein LOC117274471 isoform X2 [Nicotiana tomentosiformis]